MSKNIKKDSWHWKALKLMVLLIILVIVSLSPEPTVAVEDSSAKLEVMQGTNVSNASLMIVDN